MTSPNQQTVTRYLEAFRRTDRAAILDCVTDDVAWSVPGFYHAAGKDAFAEHIVDDGFVGRPEIAVTRLIEADDVVVAEGTVRAPRSDGTTLELAFCDVFEMRDAKISALTSYLVTISQTHG